MLKTLRQKESAQFHGIEDEPITTEEQAVKAKVDQELGTETELRKNLVRRVFTNLKMGILGPEEAEQIILDYCFDNGR